MLFSIVMEDSDTVTARLNTLSCNSKVKHIITFGTSMFTHT